MLKQACIALAVSTLVFCFGIRLVQAGWSGAGSSLTLSASSPLISIKKNKKHHGEGLTECTIEQSGSGGGCKAGFKRVCEKMKSGDKCCGCVPDKGTSAGQSAPTGGGGNSSGGGIKPVEQPSDSLLLPYCDLTKDPPEGACELFGKK
jgi:hypothetical protein